MSLQKTQHVHYLELADHLLIEQASAGDHWAFEALVHRYQSRLHGFARHYLSDEQAHDIVQGVLLQFYLSLIKTPGDYFAGWRGMAFKSWLFRVTFNRCIDELRTCKRRPQSFSELEHIYEEEGDILDAYLDPAPLPEEYAELQEKQALIRAAIQTLPSTASKVVWLRYAEDLSFHDIGNRLHILPSTAHTYYYRALLKLRRTLLRTGFS